MQVYITPGIIYIAKMPYSEVMMHMRMAGRYKFISLTEHNRVRVFRDDSHKDECGAVTPGEAGLFYDEIKKQYYYNLES